MLVMGYKLNFWDYVFYTSMSIVLLWIILKSVGIIHTPFWLQYGLPASSFVIGVFALYYNLIKSITDMAIKTGNIEKDVEILKDNNKVLKYDVDILKNKVTLIEQRV